MGKEIGMKKFIVLVPMIFLSVVVYGQTSLDTLLFSKINEYRASKRLNQVKWDTTGYRAAHHHSSYLKGKYLISHHEDSAVFESAGSRYRYFGGNTDMISEVIACTNGNFRDVDPCVWDKLAEEILTLWKKSPPHNRIILDPSNTSGGCSNAVTTREQGIRGVKNHLVVSTFVFR